MDVGQICIKIKGREAGRKVVVLSEMKDGKVLIDGEKVKRRNCNVLHLFPLTQKIKIGKEAKHDEILKLMKKK